MNWEKIVSAACVSALGIVTAPASHAHATSTATLSGFSYTLTDLDPNDGISPNLTLTAPNYWIATAAYPDGSGYPDPVNIISQPGISYITTATGYAVASYDDFNASSVVMVNEHAPQHASNVITQWHFALTPNTAVTFTSFGAIHAEHAGDLTTDAYAQLFAAYLPSPSAPYETYLDDSLYAYYGQNQSRELNVTLSSGVSELDGRVGLGTTAYGQSVAAPVPEPATYAMLVCGLVAIGYAKRRTKA